MNRYETDRKALGISEPEFVSIPRKRFRFSSLTETRLVFETIRQKKTHFKAISASPKNPDLICGITIKQYLYRWTVGTSKVLLDAYLY